MNHLKISVLMDPKRPKVAQSEVVRTVRDAGFEVVSDRAELDIVVGGDGVFSYFGRVKSVPLLFVGVRSRKVTGSKAYLAEVTLDQLGSALRKIRSGNYRVAAYRRLEVVLNRRRLGDVFTDVSLERGADSNCLRYKLVARWNKSGHTDFAISNGVVVCTSAGSTGYFSYLDKVMGGRGLRPDVSSRISESSIGISHIIPTYTERERSRVHPLRYTIPWDSEIRIHLMRDADARLYGVTRSQKGVRVEADDVVLILPSPNSTQVVEL